MNYNIYIHRNLVRSHQPRHHTGRRDANPWKSKIWRLSLLHHPPAPLPQSPDKLRTLYEFLHEVQTIIIRFSDREGEIIFVSDEIRAKRPQKQNDESKKIGILRKNGKNQKAHKSILSGRVGKYVLKQSVKY